MKKKELLILVEKINKYHLDLDFDISRLLKLDNKIVDILVKLDDVMFINAYKTTNLDIDNKLFVILMMSKVKEPLITDIIYKLALNKDLKDYEYVIRFISECTNIDFATSYHFLFSNKEFMSLSNYKDIIHLLSEEKRPNMIKFIGGIITNEYLYQNKNFVSCYIDIIRKCSDEHIGFITYRILKNDLLKQSDYYKYCIEKIVLCKSKKMAEVMYMVMTNKNMLNRSDYLDIINALFDRLMNDEYYKITDINKIISNYLKNDNYNELKGSLENVSDDEEIEEKMLVLMIK